MKAYTLFTLIFLYSLTSIAQDQTQLSPEEANARYFEIPRETIYAHLNKSTYLKGEEIWFKGYAYDRKHNLPSETTANFNVELFSHNGDEVYSGLHLGYQGSTQGTITIDSTWASGDYYLRVSTNWMNNFVEDDSYVQKIIIVNERAEKADTTKATKYDFQLLPEGGHLVLDTDNTIGFKVTNDEGYGIIFDKGKVTDKEGNEITTFTSNRLGIGKFSFKPVPGKQYKASITLDSGQEVTAAFPKIEPKGIAVSMNNLFDDRVLIELNTNTSTLNDIVNKEYNILVHQNDLSKVIAVTFKEGQTKKVISLKRNTLYPGVNMITLFENNIPILERILFNNVGIPIRNAKVAHLNTVKDSLLMSIQLPKKDSVTYNVSVSVLPAETKSYDHQDNMISAMFLKPYLKGFIEDSKYYFTNTNRAKVYDLDLLLITQGWSKYNWDTIFKYKSDISYGFGNGLTIKGKLQNLRDKNIKQVYVHPTKNSPPRFIGLDSTNSFIINNYYPEKKEPLRVSAVKANGKFIKTAMYLQLQSNRFKKSFETTVPSKADISNTITNTIEIPDYFFNDETELLDEVVIKGKPKFSDVSRFIIKNSRKITVHDTKQYHGILDYIAAKGGYRVFNNPGEPVQITPLSNVSIMSNGVDVFLENMILLDFDILKNYTTEDFERIYINKQGLGGRDPRNHVIRLYRRKTPLNKPGTNKQNSNIFTEYSFDKGFEPVKMFYNPTYTSFSDPFFEYYGTIHWEPYISFDQAGTGTFKIPDTGTQNIKLFIEGMGSDGSLISKVEVLELN